MRGPAGGGFQHHSEMDRGTKGRAATGFVFGFSSDQKLLHDTTSHVVHSVLCAVWSSTEEYGEYGGKIPLMHYMYLYSTFPVLSTSQSALKYKPHSSIHIHTLHSFYHTIHTVFAQLSRADLGSVSSAVAEG